MTLNRRTLLGAVGASPLIWTVACPALAETPRDLVVMAMPIGDIVSLDPHESFEFTCNEVLGNTYDRLILPNLKDPTDIKGDLAESWSTSEDGLRTHPFQGVVFPGASRRAVAAWVRAILPSA